MDYVINNTAPDWSRLRYELEESLDFSTYQKIFAWIALDRPSPPPSAYKQELVKNYARHYGLPVLVETGTFQGGMVEACLDSFEEIHSIELSRELYEKAVKKFKGNKKVRLYQGDSGAVLEKVVKKLRKPALFWLDAHYSMGETAKGSLNTPIIKELEVIFSRWKKNQAILIDDARLFNGKEDYPTVSRVQKIISSQHQGIGLINRNDVLRLQPGDSIIDV